MDKDEVTTTITVDTFAKFYTLGEISDKLKLPFNLEDIYWKPQSTRGTRALGAPYADPRAYEDRLNEVCPEQWTTTVVCTPTAQKFVCIVELSICGIVRCGDGDAPNNDKNMVTSAYAQAFKRACSRFGLGRYLYSLPKTWVEYQPGKKDGRSGKTAPGRITPKGTAKLEKMYLDHTRAKPVAKKETPLQKKTEPEKKKRTPQPEPPPHGTVVSKKEATPQPEPIQKKKPDTKKEAREALSRAQAAIISAGNIKFITDLAEKLVDDKGQQRYVLTIKKVRDNLMSALAINPRPLTGLTVREGGLLYWYMQSQLDKAGDELAAIKERGKVIAEYAQKDKLTWEDAEKKYSKDIEGANNEPT